MSGNVLWTSIFNQPGSQANELTRQRIVQEERVGRRPANTMSSAEHAAVLRGESDLRDPWVAKPAGERYALQPPISGYGGTIPMYRPEHTGENNGEQAAAFVPHFGSEGYADTKARAPGGGASALGTRQLPPPGHKNVPGRTLFESLEVAREADPFAR